MTVLLSIGEDVVMLGDTGLDALEATLPDAGVEVVPPGLTGLEAAAVEAMEREEAAETVPLRRWTTKRSPCPAALERVAQAARVRMVL